MNISLTKLGHEECEQCEQMTQHKSMCDCTEICDVWVSWRQHKTKFIQARKEYRSDSGQPKKNNTLIVSSDLQKVVMLPRMDQFKTSIFTRRLCLFNETFAEVGTDLINDDDETNCEIFRKNDIIS